MNDNIKPKSTMFERIIDDFINKRYGAGEAFYGKRTSRLSEEEFANSKGKKRIYDKNAPMKDNAILIVGGLNELGRWIAFEMDDKGFNVRVSSSKLRTAVDIFGFPGYNVDMIELKGEDTSEEVYAQAINGVQAIVLCVNFSPKFEDSNSKKQQDEELVTALRVIDIARRANLAGVGQIKKIVLVSRYVPSEINSSPDIVSSFFFQLADSPNYTEFRKRHAKVEEYLRKSKIDYVIVRAPPLVITPREPSQFKLTLLSSKEKIAALPPTKKSPLENLALGDVDCAKIGVLDLAEVTTQALLQDVSDITFSVFETDSVNIPDLRDKPAIISGQKELENTRVLREAFYAVMNMTDDELRTSYMMKSPEEYKRQLEEDVAVEKYWLQRLVLLEKD